MIDCTCRKPYLSTAQSHEKADKSTLTVYTATHTMFYICCKDSAKPCTSRRLSARLEGDSKLMLRSSFKMTSLPSNRTEVAEEVEFLEADGVEIIWIEL